VGPRGPPFVVVVGILTQGARRRVFGVVYGPCIGLPWRKVFCMRAGFKLSVLAVGVCLAVFADPLSGVAVSSASGGVPVLLSSGI
jgi:hypothetical protein